MNYNMYKINPITPGRVGIARTAVLITAFAAMAVLTESCGKDTVTTRSVKGGGSVGTTGPGHRSHCSGAFCPSR